MWLSKIWAKLNTVECLHLFTKVVYIIRERRQNKEKKKKEKKKNKTLKIQRDQRLRIQTICALPGA